MIHKREKTKDNHAKLEFMNGSNFVKLSKRMHIWPHDIRIFHMDFVKIHYRPRIYYEF